MIQPQNSIQDQRKILKIELSNTIRGKLSQSNAVCLGKLFGVNKSHRDQKQWLWKAKSKKEVRSGLLMTNRVALRRQGRQFESGHPDLKAPQIAGLFLFLCLLLSTSYSAIQFRDIIPGQLRIFKTDCLNITVPKPNPFETEFLGK